MLVLQEEKSHVKVFDAEAVDKNVQGSQEIPHTVVTDSGQATELRTEHENQKKKLKMDNLAQQELKRNKEKLSKEAKTLTEEVTKHRTTAPDLEGGKTRARKRKVDTLMEQARGLKAQIEEANNHSAHLRENKREIEVVLKRAERDWLQHIEQQWRVEKNIRIQDQLVKDLQNQLGQVKRQICELKNEEAKEATINQAVQEEYLCDDCRYC